MLTAVSKMDAHVLRGTEFVTSITLYFCMDSSDPRLLSVNEYKKAKDKALKGFRASVLSLQEWENYCEAAITDGICVGRVLVYDRNVETSKNYIFRNMSTSKVTNTLVINRRTRLTLTGNMPAEHAGFAAAGHELLHPTATEVVCFADIVPNKRNLLVKGPVTKD